MSGQRVYPALAAWTRSPYNPRMITEVLRPRNVEEAISAGRKPGAAYLGGGTWLSSPAARGVTTLVSLERLGLSSIEVSSTRVVLEARVTFQQILDAPGLPEAIYQSVRLTASRTLRAMITIGGEIGLLPPDSPLLCALLALDARIAIAGASEQIPMERYLAEPPRGLVLSVALDRPVPLGAVQAVSRTSHSPRSVIVAVAARSLRPHVTEPRIVVGDGRRAAVRLIDTENRLRGVPLASKAGDAKARIEEWVRQEVHPEADIHASVEYKRYIAGVLVADALEGLAEQTA